MNAHAPSESNFASSKVIPLHRGGELRSRVLSLEEGLYDAIEVYGYPDRAGGGADGGRDSGSKSLPRAWDQLSVA